MKPYNKNNIPLARGLRKNMTPWERKLWYDFLRSYPTRFLRQKPIGNYIADFYCAQARLIIELDGSQHFEQINVEKDTERTKYLEQFGLTVVRIPNNLIDQQFQAVCEYIDLQVQEKLAKVR
ncbi:MAG: endonuclease domain-containing protein [Clostridia bacterium]|nr:endonuclease domain-containing protein [Clostridia bacterium]